MSSGVVGAIHGGAAASASEAPRPVRLGDATLPFPSPSLGRLVDSTDAWASADAARLRADFAANGYVFIRGLIPPAAVAAARAHVLASLPPGVLAAAPGGAGADAAGAGAAGAAGAADDALLAPRCGLGCVPFMEGRNAVTHAPAVLRVLEAPELRAAAEALLGERAVPFDYKWLRGVPRQGFTGVHVDAVYMARGSARVLTSWLPLDPAAPLERGALAVLGRSHAAPSLARFRATYGALDVERAGVAGTGWFGTDPLEVAALAGATADGVRWETADFRGGDALLFGLLTAHASTVNVTDALRLSADVRWSPASEPVDARYVGSAEEVDPSQRARAGAWAADGAPPPAAVTVDALKQTWALGA